MDWLSLFRQCPAFSFYVIFTEVNASIIRLRLGAPYAYRTFVTPFSIRRIPVLPILGTGVVALMMVNLEARAWFVGLSVASGRNRLLGRARPATKPAHEGQHMTDVRASGYH